MSINYPIWVNVFGSDLNNIRAKTTAILAFRATLDGYRVLLTERSSDQFYELTPHALFKHDELEIFYLENVPKDRHLVVLAQNWHDKNEQEFANFASSFDLVFCSCGEAKQKSGISVLAGSYDGLDLQESIATIEKIKDYSFVGILPDKTPIAYDINLTKQKEKHKFLTDAIGSLPLLNHEIFTTPKSDKVDVPLWNNAAEVIANLNLPEKNKSAQTPDDNFINKAKAIFGVTKDSDFAEIDPPASTEYINNIFVENPAADTKLTERMNEYIEKLDERSNALYQKQADKVKQVNDLTQEQIAIRNKLDNQSKESRSKQIQANQEKLTDEYNQATSELNKLFSSVNQQIEEDFEATAERLASGESIADKVDDLKESISAEVEPAVVDDVVRSETNTNDAKANKVDPVITRQEAISFKNYVDHKKIAKFLNLKDIVVEIKELTSKLEYEALDIENSKDINQDFLKLQDKYKQETAKEETNLTIIYVIVLEVLNLASKSSLSDNKNLEVLIRNFAQEIFTNNIFSEYSFKYWFINTLWLAEYNLAQHEYTKAGDLLNKLINTLYKANEKIDTEEELKIMRAVLTYLLATTEDLNSDANEDSSRSNEIVKQLMSELPAEAVENIFSESVASEEIPQKVLQSIQDAKAAFGKMIK